MLQRLYNHDPKLKKLYNGFEDKWFQIKCSPKEILLNFGEISKYIFFIEEGCLRLWYNNHGNDVNIQFFFENDVVTSFESLMKNIPSDFSIEAIEPTQLLAIHKADWFKIMELKPELKDVLIEHISERFIDYMNHFTSYIQDSPEERYQKLAKEKSHIIKRVPLKHIASYLGITTVSLSRIRARK